MGTKTDDAAAAKGAAGTGADAEADEVTAAGEPETVDVTKSDAADAADAKTDVDADADTNTDTDTDDEALDEPDAEPVAAAKSTDVGMGAAAVVSAALGVIGLSGGWLGTIAGARSNIMGQLDTKARQSASVSDQLQAMYGDSWQATALVAGLFALSALVIGFLVLVRPAFGAPGKEPAPWIKSVAWAGFVLGVIGLVLAIAKYSDLLLGLPSAPS
ncbi:hypothetical protein DEJ49_26130 [Streptomyces venezuelae]|uniref:Uncharacterized protein n=1 Tax=Streptomyces venezuelae TaxID=54571 RepID=A0A5P2CMF7_STRVZ|nr:hypothetical protein [Streptomyces venezuelae]QES44005.1 hypothetical protein DEJ49_26130 [Streptomyces venezuelae]